MQTIDIWNTIWRLMTIVVVFFVGIPVLLSSFRIIFFKVNVWCIFWCIGIIYIMIVGVMVLQQYFSYIVAEYTIIPYIFCNDMFVKLIRQFGWFTDMLLTRGDNLNIYIYDYVVARSTTPANKNFFENPCFFSPVP